MFAKVAVISIVAGVAAAQSTAIPTGISSECSAFLTKMNSDSSLTACTKGLWSAVESFDASTSSISESLSSFCSSSASCSQDTIRSNLVEFYSSCPNELAGGANKDVTLIYDTIYALSPFQEALCAKGDDGAFCATSGGSSNDIPLTDGGSMPAQQVLDNMGTSAPNANTFSSTNMLFMFLTPSTPTAKLCTSCTRNVMSAYISFQSQISYGPGFASSVLFQGQSALYNAIQNNCGANFLSGQLQAAGSLSDSGTTNLNGGDHTKMLSGGLVALSAAFSLIASAAF